jgi:hypothetical protein
MDPSEGNALALISLKPLRGGVSGPIGVVGARVTGCMGNVLIGCAAVLGPVRVLEGGDVGKNLVCARVRRQVA